MGLFFLSNLIMATRSVVSASAKKNLVASLHEIIQQKGMKINQKETTQVLESVFDLIKNEIATKDVFTYPNFGKFSVRISKPHTRDVSHLNKGVGIVHIP